MILFWFEEVPLGLYVYIYIFTYLYLGLPTRHK